MTAAEECVLPTGELPDRASLLSQVPRQCLRPSTLRSVTYLARDLVLLGVLYAVAAQIDGWVWMLPVWFVQGTLLWALFLIGHDCGHGSFSRNRRVNEWIGHLVHTPLLVPYHSWRISHRRHHRHTGDVDRDEAWFPLTNRQLRRLPPLTRWARRWLPFALLPFYLMRNSPGRHGTHFSARSPLFADGERHLVRRSLACCAAFALVLIGAGAAFGPGFVVRFYVGPYVVFAAWLSVVTFLHHTDPSLPWYRGAAWTPLHGALTTIDRDYGVFERIHHDVGSHTAHHLFPAIPHYHLRSATEAIAPALGPAYRRAEQSVPRAFWRALRECGCIPEEGAVVYYRRWPPSDAPRGDAGPKGLGASPATT